MEKKSPEKSATSRPGECGGRVLAFVGKLDREEVLSMMNEIMSKTAGFAHIVATEGDVQYLMATCDEDGATRPCRAALAACGGCSRAVGARGGRRFRRLPQGERGEKDA